MWAKILTRLFALFGMTLTCVACYGTMYTEYDPMLRRASGIVEDSEGNPIEGIKVSTISTETYTNKDGWFYVQDIVGTAHFEDVDGEANGGKFQSRSINLTNERVDEYYDLGIVTLYREDENLSNQ